MSHDCHMTPSQIEDTEDLVYQLFPYAESVHQHIQDVYNSMQGVLVDISTVNAVIQPIISMLQEKAEGSEVISMEIANTTSMHNQDFSSERARAAALLIQVTRVSDMVTLYLGYAQNQLEQAVNVSLKYQGVSSDADQLTNQIAGLRNLLNESTVLLDAISAAVQQLEVDVAMAIGIIRYSNVTLESADSTVNQIRNALMRIRNYIQEFQVIVGEEATNDDLVGGSGSGSRTGSGIGSGMSPFDSTTSPPPDATPTSVIMGVAMLQERVDILDHDVSEREEVVQEGGDNLIQLRGFAEGINK